MRPRDTPLDLPNSWSTDPVLLSDALKRNPLPDKLSDLQYLPLCQFGKPLSLASRLLTALHSIGCVVLNRADTKMSDVDAGSDITGVQRLLSRAEVTPESTRQRKSMRSIWALFDIQDSVSVFVSLTDPHQTIISPTTHLRFKARYRSRHFPPE